MNSLPLNQVLHGDSTRLLNELPEKSVDVIFADPPYNLQLQKELWRPNLTRVDAVDDEWDRFDSLADYDDFTRAWLNACRRVLKDTGTLWVIGSYHNIFRVGTALQDLDYWILNDISWIKCLAGDTQLYVLLNGKPLISTIKDLIRIDLSKNSIELPSYDENGRLAWVDLIGWQHNGKARGVRLEVETGAVIECTADHRFPVARNGQVEMMPAEQIQVGDKLLQLSHFEMPQVTQSAAMDKAMGEFVGWFLAEGSMLAEDKGIQLSMSKDETAIANDLIRLLQQRLGVVGRIHIYRNSLHLVFPGKFVMEFVRRFVRGENAKTKHLTREAFFYGIEFLEGVLHGYLLGDAHWDKLNQRWRLGFTRNEDLLTDLRVIAQLTYRRLHAAIGQVPFQRGAVDIIRGEIRENGSGQWSRADLDSLGLSPRRGFSRNQDYSLAYIKDKYKLITRKNPVGEMTALATQVLENDLRLINVKAKRPTTLKTFYDLSVNGNHVFALANGVLTHNSNPMPNFRGVRFTNAHETLIWAQKKRGAKYTFNYRAMKSLNEDVQMRSDWYLSLCTGHERLKVNGQKAHATQKPEALLYRVLLASTNPGDVVLDPFFGTGTTGAVAKKLHRHYIGIEKESKYVELARERLAAVTPDMFPDDSAYVLAEKRATPRIPFGALLEHGLLRPGQTLYFGKKGQVAATVLANGHLQHNGTTGSIHAVGRAVQNSPSCNGWEHWFYEDGETGERKPINTLREQLLTAR